MEPLEEREEKRSCAIQGMTTNGTVIPSVTSPKILSALLRIGIKADHVITVYLTHTSLWYPKVSPSPLW